MVDRCAVPLTRHSGFMVLEREVETSLAAETVGHIWSPWSSWNTASPSMVGVLGVPAFPKLLHTRDRLGMSQLWPSARQRELTPYIITTCSWSVELSTAASINTGTRQPGQKKNDEVRHPISGTVERGIYRLLCTGPVRRYLAASPHASSRRFLTSKPPSGLNWFLGPRTRNPCWLYRPLVEYLSENLVFLLPFNDSCKDHH
jgi:hypothetical protein